MGESKFTILDHIDGIKVPGNVFKEPRNEYWALIYLRDGLDFLYRQVSHFDTIVSQQLEYSPGSQHILGNHLALSNIPKSLLTCAFHWYAISAFQYVRTVGAIVYRQDNTRLPSEKYVKQVIPEVLTFRDKVAAHFAWATKHSQDNDAERRASIIPQLGLVNGSLGMCPFQVSVNRGGAASSSINLKPWSLSEVHERLRQRYWPTT